MRITAEKLTRTPSQVHAGPSVTHAPRAGSTPPRPAPGDFLRPAARHPLESITPVGLVLLALLSASVGLVLAVLLKLLSMALSVSH